MRTRGRAPRLATAALLLAAMTSCADDRADAPTNPRPSRSSPAPTSATSPPPTSATSPPPAETKVASKAATVVLRKYYDVRNKLRQDPSQPLTQLASVAISTELAAQRNLFKSEREKGLHQIGETKVVELEVKSVNLDNTIPKAGKVPTVQIDLCFDVADVDVVDADGKSVISPDRPDTGWIQFLVSNYQWDTDPAGGWRVTSSQDMERSPCAAT